MTPYTQGLDDAFLLYGVKTSSVVDFVKQRPLTTALGLGTLLSGGMAVRDAWKGRKFDDHWARVLFVRGVTRIQG